MKQPHTLARERARILDICLDRMLAEVAKDLPSVKVSTPSTKSRGWTRVHVKGSR